MIYKAISSYKINTQNIKYMEATFKKNIYDVEMLWLRHIWNNVISQLIHLLK